MSVTGPERPLRILLKCDAAARMHWLQALARHLPGAEVEAWPDCPNAERADYALLWQPDDALLARLAGVGAIFSLGAGVINTSPKSTIVPFPDRTDEIGHVGAGLRVYAMRRFLLRAEYKSYVVFTSRDENEEVEEWKVGFAFFF